MVYILCFFIIFIIIIACPVLSYLVENGHCFITLCDSSYPRKLAFHYLQDLKKKFQKFDIGLLDKVTKPYSFVRFGNSTLAFPNSVWLLRKKTKRKKMQHSKLIKFPCSFRCGFADGIIRNIKKQ